VVVELVTHVVLLLRNYLIHIFGGRSVNFGGILPAQLFCCVESTSNQICDDHDFKALPRPLKKLAWTGKLLQEIVIFGGGGQVVFSMGVII
jgi:hypothetical protein